MYLLTPQSISDIRRSAACSKSVSGLTHKFYRYPARFSPQFARACIASFTEPEDLVLDPFMGGGTTIVESLALGRYAVGTDISSLASFISKVKTTPLSQQDRKSLNLWINQIPHITKINQNTKYECNQQNLGFQQNINSRDTWRIRKAVKLCLESLYSLKNIKQEEFARCVVLNAAQWALDGNKKIPCIYSFRKKLLSSYKEMARGELDLYSSIKENYTYPIRTSKKMVRCLNKSAINLEKNDMQASKQLKLVLTSPPYPGIHVLYHRWQVLGRRETATPFWIADKLDGAGESYYTLGNRNQEKLYDYFKNITKIFTNIRRLASKDTIFVQMVSFSKPQWQLTKYLECMQEAGLREIKPCEFDISQKSRIWRTVPQRKWHANFIGRTHGSKEVVLFHKIDK